MEKSAQIVVVDDHAAALKATMRLLERAGYRVRGAETGRDGLELIRRHRPELVLLDVVLPDIGGAEVLAAVRSDPQLENVAVVFLSSQQTGPEHQAGGLDAGADGYLARPISNEELLARVRLHLRQRELTQRLRENEARFRALVDTLGEAILVVSPRGNVRYANPAAEALFQRSRDQLYRAPFGIPIDAAQGGRPQVIELPRGELPPVVAELHSSDLWWEEERAWIVSLRDVTAEYTAQQALRSSERRYREMVEHLPDIVYINRYERIIYINPAGVRLLRANSEADILGRSPFDFIHPDFHELVRERIHRAREAPMASPLTENCLVALDGTEIPVEVTAISYNSGEGIDIQVIARDITLRKQAEAERQQLLAREKAARREAVEASRYYRSLFESAPGSYLVLTPRDYEIVAISEAYLQATGSTRQQLAGRRLFDVFFPDHPTRPDAAARLRASLERVEREGRADVMGVEFFPVPQSAERGGGVEDRYFSIVHAPVSGPDGRVAYIIHRVEDVTDYLVSMSDSSEGRRQLAARTDLMEADIVLRSRELDEARRQLEENQALLRMASDLAQLGAWSVELPDFRMSWSDEVYEIHGVPPGTPLEVSRGIEFYAPEYRKAITTAFTACVEHGRPYDLELQIINTAGRRVWVRAIGEAVRDAAGRIVRVQGAFQDISGRKAAEARESQLQDRLAAMLERIGEGFIALDRDWMLTYVNAEAERIVQRKRGELLGQSLWQAFPEAVGSVFEAEYRRAVRDGVAVNFEEYFAPLGIWVEVRAYPSEEGLAIYFRDVTRERKLEHHVQQSQRLEAVGQLTGGVAHDFNNLLTVILGNAELMAEKLGKDTPLGGLAMQVSTAAQRGARLTAALLAFARRQALEPVAVDVNELLRGMHDMLRRTLGEDIDIEFQTTTGIPPAMVDPAQFESAILNLCLNARDAMPEGGRLTIETGLRELDEDYVDSRIGVVPGEYIMVAVSDTGCGIPVEHLPRLFEPFFTTKARGKGTGLGLPMVYGFVRQSGGQVNVYSEVGEGTTFRLYLPQALGAEVAQRAETQRTSPAGGAEKILLVEDDEMVRMYAEDLLGGLGYAVTTAASGPEAVSLLEQGAKFDLLFTDVVMPGGMNGRELAERAAILQPGLRVLYTSGYTENAIVHHGRLDAGVDLLSKPYRRAELAARVREILDRPASGETPS